MTNDLDLKEHPILILDFGSQYTQLVARRVRESGVYCEIHPYDMSESEFLAAHFSGIILSGGPATVTERETPKAPEWVFASHLPILGICYGMQTMALQMGGKVETSHKKEFGYAEVSILKPSSLFQNLSERHNEEGLACLDVWMSHGDHVTELPEGFDILCSTKNAPIAGMMAKDKPWYGLQFHPEVTHTPSGSAILRHFILDICHCEPTWDAKNIIEESIQTIREKVGNERVLLGLSGGVDSSVAAMLLSRAIGSNLYAVFVDTGLLRKDEARAVMEMFHELDIEVHCVNAEERFLKALQGVTCPEEKRKTIGRLFIEVFEEEAKRQKEISWLAQGTIYSDVIESAKTSTGSASMVIKSHHNVGGLPERLNLKLIEPLRELFKDEVREIGMALGLSKEMVYRHPFPGAGLGVRILGEIKKEYADTLREVDAIFIEALHEAGLYDQVSQAFAVFLPVKSVGVTGDGRRYDHVVSLRAVVTSDFMTAHFAELPWDFLNKVSLKIINEVPHISRVTYDISGKPPATIEWE